MHLSEKRLRLVGQSALLSQRVVQEIASCATQIPHEACHSALPLLWVGWRRGRTGGEEEDGGRLLCLVTGRPRGCPRVSHKRRNTLQKVDNTRLHENPHATHSTFTGTEDRRPTARHWYPRVVENECNQQNATRRPPAKASLVS